MASSLFAVIAGCGGGDSTSSGISERDAAFNRIALFRTAMADREIQRACEMAHPNLQTYIGNRCVVGPVGRPSDWLAGPVVAQKFRGDTATETYGDVAAHTQDAIDYNLSNHPGGSVAAVVSSVTTIKVGPRDWEILAFDARVP